jgi:hypothetical protein
MTGNYSTKIYSFECDHVKRTLTGTVAELAAVVPVSIILFLFLATQFL